MSGPTTGAADDGARRAQQAIDALRHGWPVAIDGVAVRDTPAAVAAFLARYGDPYRAIGDDRRGAVQVSLGSSGVPESYVVGADGRIILQHVGDIRAEDVSEIAFAAGADRGEER